MKKLIEKFWRNTFDKIVFLAFVIIELLWLVFDSDISGFFSFAFAYSCFLLVRVYKLELKLEDQQAD